MSSTTKPMPPGEEVVASYLANRLTEDEAQAFETYCLEHPEFAREVERDLSLKTGFRYVDQQPAEHPAAAKKSQGARWPLALAASIAVVVIGAAVFFSGARNHEAALIAYASKSELPPHLQRGSVSRVNLIHLRGSQSTTLAAVPRNGVIEIRLLPDFPADTHDYWVKIATEPSGPASPVTLRKLMSAADGFLLIYLPADQLIGRTSLISLGPDNDPAHRQEAERFRVHFEAAP